MPAVQIGTVDKFQGQEAPVVIYSLTTSSPEDAPRGMEFLYSLNRLKYRRFKGDVQRDSSRESETIRARVPESPADEASERIVPLSGISQRC